MKRGAFGYLHLVFFLLVVAASGCLRAADFEVILAKGVENPTGLKRGDELNRGQIVVVGTAGLLIVRQLQGCSTNLVAVGPKKITLRIASGGSCTATIDKDTLTARLATGEPLLERVALAGDGKADGFADSIAGGACLNLPEVSEDTHGGFARCPSGYLVSGMTCSGSYCDNKRLMCCPYLDGRADPSMHNYDARWISEETSAYSTGDFVNGISCRGSYCDDVLPHAVESPRFENTGQCSWTASFSEEAPSGAFCPNDFFVSGVRCSGSYCDNLALKCCALKRASTEHIQNLQRQVAPPVNP